MILGEYEVQEVLGRGGMGIVHRARHVVTGEMVAVKILTGDLVADPSLLRRFEKECAAAQQLDHPNIVRGYSCRTDGKPAYLVMELVEGLSLEQVVRRRGSLPEADGLNLICQCAEGLHAAHLAGLVHRDVKPDNILVTADGTAKLTDLGLVKIQDGEEALTRSGAWLGTIAYMAPEQFGEARDSDARADVYGLAATLYRALTGAVPFPDRGGLAILGKKLRNDFVPPRQLIPTLSEGVDRAIRQALSSDPESRPRSAREFAALLAQASPAAEGPDPAERRAARRLPAMLAVMCRPLNAGTRAWRGNVLDLSTSGVRLALDRRFEPSTILTLWLEDGQASTFLVKVRWSVQTKSGRWEAGCQFSAPLADDELAALLGDHPPTVLLAPAR